MTSRLEKILREIPLDLRKQEEHFDPEAFVVQNGQVPHDYLTALNTYHGGTGTIGDFYIDLWEPEEIFNLNKDYRVEEFAPGFTIFGSDGGDTAFVFERNTGLIYEFPFVGMTIDEPAAFISKSFEEFFDALLSFNE